MNHSGTLVTESSQDTGNTYSQDIGNTSLKGGGPHALERCYRERATTEVSRGFQAELLLHHRPRRTLRHLEADRPQMGQQLREARPRRLPPRLGSWPDTDWFPPGAGIGALTLGVPRAFLRAPTTSGPRTTRASSD